jgi:SAM-dependent methyltransferase
MSRLPEDTFFIRQPYEAREETEYFDDTADEVEYQPDVYPLAAFLGRRFGCRAVVDLGCGTARKLARLHPEFEVIGVDIGPNLAECRRRYDFGHWLECDLEQATPPVEATVLDRAVVVCADVIEHLRDPRPLLRTLSEWLGRAPVGIVSTPARDLVRGPDDHGPPTNPAHVREWEGAELRQLLQTAGLTVPFLGLTASNDLGREKKTLLALLERPSASDRPSEAGDWTVELQEDEDLVAPWPEVGLEEALVRVQAAGYDHVEHTTLLRYPDETDPGKWLFTFDRRTSGDRPRAGLAASTRSRPYPFRFLLQRRLAEPHHPLDLEAFEPQSFGERYLVERLSGIGVDRYERPSDTQARAIGHLREHAERLRATVARLEVEAAEAGEEIEALHEREAELTVEVARLAGELNERGRVLAATRESERRQAAELEDLLRRLEEKDALIAELQEPAPETAQDVDEVLRLQVVKQVRQIAARVLPSGARVLVVSRGDTDIVELGGVQASHFPQADGGYAGYHPGSGTEAVEHLEELRGQGAEYLLIPRWSLWWLDEYPELKAELYSRHRPMLIDDECQIFRLREPTKGEGEIAYWRQVLHTHGSLSNGHFEAFHTTHFGLDPEFYRGKRVLDVGCGPRGSLEWANVAAERVGLDPLADAYRELGTDRHAMTYVSAPVESIPYPDAHFDVISSFNSLDHVDDLDRAVEEIVRVLTPRGLFLLLTDVNHPPTLMEPVSFSWDVVQLFQPALDLLEERHYEKRENGMYQSIDAAVAYDHADPTERYGVLSAKFVKKP